METSFTGKKDAIRFGVIRGAYLIDPFTYMPCDGCTVLTHILHFFKDCSPVFIQQGQKKIFDRSCSALSVIVTPLSFILWLPTPHHINLLEIYHI